MATVNLNCTACGRPVPIDMEVLTPAERAVASRGRGVGLCAECKAATVLPEVSTTHTYRGEFYIWRDDEDDALVRVTSEAIEGEALGMVWDRITASTAEVLAKARGFAGTAEE